MSHAIISGGSSGIGLALSRKLAGQNWRLSLLARDAAKLELARAELGSVAGNSDGVHVASVDVSDEPSTTLAVKNALDRFGPPDLVVTSAGIVIPGTFSELPATAFRSTMEINYFGTLNVIRAALPSMRERRTGRIVLVSSGAGLIGLYGYTAYAPTKFAVRGLAEALRAELRPDGIEVSIVYPPDTDTPQLREELTIRPEITSKIAGGARVHTAEEVADAILKGIDKRRFAIAPGWEMSALSRLHSLIGPLLNRYSFDPVIARELRRQRMA